MRYYIKFLETHNYNNILDEYIEACKSMEHEPVLEYIKHDDNYLDINLYSNTVQETLKQK